MRPLTVKAGEAVIFDSALIHSSSPNTSSEMWLAINFFVRPKEADYLHFYRDKKTPRHEVELYNVTPEFYISHDIMERPDKKFPYLGTQPLSNPKFNWFSVRKLLKTISKEYESA